MSIKALGGRNHVHDLKDDLESLIYVVLYAALLWLPVESPFNLRWWMTDFFSAPHPGGSGGGEDWKWLNALVRRYTSDLNSKESPHVVDWLTGAMELHYKNGSPNPLWDDGKALGKFWEGILAKDLPSNDRRVNPIFGTKIQPGGSLQATYTAATSAQDLYRYRNDPTQSVAPPPAKRSVAQSADDNFPRPAPPPSKRPRTGERPRARSLSTETHRDEDLMTGVGTATISLGAADTLSSEES